MRDRRNTHLSNASTSSTSSADTSTTTSARNSMSEKDIEQCVHPLHSDHKSRTRRSFLFYIIATAICITCFTVTSHWLCSTSTEVPLPIRESSTVFPVQAGSVMAINVAGRDRWTVSPPPNDSFPLSTIKYQEICLEAKQSGRSKWSLQRIWRQSSALVSQDPSFMDVDEAETLGVVPSSSTMSQDTCRSSLTFVMDANASFGKTLLLLWLSYGFAKRENRAFFLDDSAWAYGRYNSYFTPLPRPGCRPPQKSHILPCPLQANHLVVTMATARSTFDEDVNAIFKRQFNARHKADTVFDLIRSGYDSMFHLIGDDASYAEQRVSQLRASVNQHHQSLVGVHIRRGDLHPFELEFSQDYLPVERFTDAAKALLGPEVATPGTLILASDDPDTIESEGLVLAASPYHLEKSQERIQLATKLALDRTSPAEPIREPGSAYVKHVDENAGWDGGFYTALFHSLGDIRTREQRLLHPARGLPSKETLRMRELVARGYLLDLAVLGRSDGVVCAVSSAACRILGIMMGREAVSFGKWVNVDDNRAWSWDGRK